ncbi:mitochondrial genome maintenance exonuclease 1 [Anolis sagrei]|uniref:mitochondrial genome maintenance exonuclease 1 n=1 Tax=Anolis sagrei TaxID=38937 RepID=UPI00351FF38A
MSLLHLLIRKHRRLELLLTSFLNKDRFLYKAFATSSPLYRKNKKISEYENIDQEKYGDLVRDLVSYRDSLQRPEYLFEEDELLYGPESKYKPPTKEAEPQLIGNWTPLMNPYKSSLPPQSVLESPLQISLEKRNLASVTAVLQQTMPLEQAFHLEKWRQRMILELGKEGFAEYTKNIFQKGKCFHAAMESLLLSDDISVKVQEEDIDGSGFVKSVKHVLQEVTRVRALESAVQHETLGYQGLVDCVAEYRGTLCVIDWKTSEKSKPFLRNTFDSPLQIAAYIGAINHDNNYNFQVDCGLLVIAYKDGSPAHPHYMDSELCSQYWKKWLHRLEEYKEKKKGSNTV